MIVASNLWSPVNLVNATNLQIYIPTIQLVCTPCIVYCHVDPSSQLVPSLHVPDEILAQSEYVIVLLLAIYVEINVCLVFMNASYK